MKIRPTENRIVNASILMSLIFLGALFIFHGRITPAPHLDDLNSGGTLDALYALGLSGLVIFIASGLGRQLFKPFKLDNWSFLERTVISLPLGLAAIGYGEFMLGMLGWLKPLHHLIFLIIVAGISLRESANFLKEGISKTNVIRSTWRGFSLIEKCFAFAGVVALLVAFLQTLTPPWDYDGLMYHLQGPRLFLDAGKILPLPENWFTFYPSTWEMVYMLGMALGSDILARLIHFSTLLLLLGSTFVFGRKWVPGKGKWMAVALMLGNPMILMLGSFAYSDIAWALFQFLTAAIVLQWSKKGENSYLLLAGVMQGLALGSKYPALLTAVIMAISVFWLSFRAQPNECRTRRSVKNVFTFGLPVLFIAIPWYLKNYIWTGNPVFPYYLPQNMVDPLQLDLFMDYLHSFGVGKAWYHYMMLPIDIFLKFRSFGTFLGETDLPNPLFLVVWLFPFVRNKITNERKVLDWLAILTLAFFIAWSTGSLQNRFLLPLMAGASILTAAVLQQLAHLRPGVTLWKLVITGLVGGMMIACTAQMGRLFFVIKPYMVTTGLASKYDFLDDLVNNFSGTDYINRELPNGSLVLMPWDGRGYYCAKDKCYPEMDQHYWASLVEEHKDPEKLLNILTKRGITHFMITNSDAAFFISGHDLNGNYMNAYKTFNVFLQLERMHLIFGNDKLLLYEIIQ